MAAGKLSSLKARALTAPGRYGDGGGLWLQVRDADHRSWLFRYTVGGRQRQMGLGAFPDVPLIEAREAAARYRASLRNGVDPIAHRRQTRVAASARGLTFRQVADKYLAAHEAAWRNEKHKYQWRQTLDFACGHIGALPVTAIAVGDVMRVLEPIWRTKTETASRLRGRIESVIDYATAHGWRSGDNPARWRGHLAKLLPAPDKIARAVHHPALRWQEIGAFMAALRGQEGITARALEFTILTAARTGEAIGAKWSEIDTNAAVWTVPPGRMKGGAEHRVPLSEAAQQVLTCLVLQRNDSAGGWVFPGGRSELPLSNMSMIMLLRRIGRDDLTVHGFRSTFRDWCAEATNYSREIAEKALAHTVGDETERSYQRADLLEKRRLLMEDWAKFCGFSEAASNTSGDSG